jgi:hypothetical protein
MVMMGHGNYGPQQKWFTAMMAYGKYGHAPF